VYRPLKENLGKSVLTFVNRGNTGCLNRIIF